MGEIAAKPGDDRYVLVACEWKGMAPLYEVERHTARAAMGWETWATDGVVWSLDDRFHAGPFVSETAARKVYPISGTKTRRDGFEIT